MKQLPALFSTPMVQAILEYRKTMTRRTRGLERVNKCPDEWTITSDTTNKGILFFNKNGFSERMKPIYQVGDHIWIRESWAKIEKLTPPDYKEKHIGIVYKANCEHLDNIKWKPSIHMFKEDARIWLECTGVRCERLQDITEADAIAEGILKGESKFMNYHTKKFEFINGKYSFYSLWVKINGEDSYYLNPWVFIYEFKRINP